MFHGYRSGTYPISAKAWRKLEEAERTAGAGTAAPPRVEETSSEPPAPENGRLSRIESLLEQLLEKMDALEANGGPATSSKVRGKKIS